jgi:hypothetical protein
VKGLRREERPGTETIKNRFLRCSTGRFDKASDVKAALRFYEVDRPVGSRRGRFRGLGSAAGFDNFLLGKAGQKFRRAIVGHAVTPPPTSSPAAHFAGYAVGDLK